MAAPRPTVPACSPAGPKASPSTTPESPRCGPSPAGWPPCRSPRWSRARCSAAWRRPTCCSTNRDDVPRHEDERIGEVRYGDWSGRELKKLAKDPLWKVVQSHPSAMTFPGEGGESMSAMATRAVAAVRDWNERLGDDAVYVVVSHADVIKAVLADALGHAPRPVPAPRRRPRIGQRRDLHDVATVRCPCQRCRWRPRLPDTPDEAHPASEVVLRRRRRRRHGHAGAACDERIGFSHAPPDLRVRPAGPLRRGHGR